jgi:hypothetical protein
MNFPSNHEQLDADARLDEVARILASGILRLRYRRLLKRIPAHGTREDELELGASSSTPVSEPAESREPQ